MSETAAARRSVGPPWPRGAATGAAVLVLVLTGVGVVGSGGHDDSHITFWVADAVARGWGFVNYDGQAVEQSSSLTFVVLLALLHLVTRVAVPVLGYWLAIFAGGAAVVQSHRLAERLTPGTGPFAAWTTATTFCLVYWSTSAMEASLAAALAPTLMLSLADVVGDRGAGRGRLALLFVVALAFTGVRPEYTFVSLGVAVTLVVLGLVTGADRRRTFMAAGLVVVSVVAIAGFRLLTFGKALPNPASAKAGGFDVVRGASYFWNVALESNAALVGVGVVGACLGVRVLGSRRARGEPGALLLGLTAALLAALVAFPIAVGGDWMKHGRFLVPAVALLAALAAALGRVLPRRPVRVLLAVVAMVGAVTEVRRLLAERDELVSLSAARELSASITRKAGPHDLSVFELANTAHLRDGPMVVSLGKILEALGPTVDEPITLASGQAGMIPYYAALRFYGRIRFIDMYSLTTDEVARCWPAAIQGRSQLGTLLSYPKLLRAGALEQHCGIARPDIVFSPALKAAFRKELEKNGYVVVYQQSGRAFGRTGPSLPGFIAIREALAERAGLTPYTYRW